jgi:hypothetical protein
VPVAGAVRSSPARKPAAWLSYTPDCDVWVPSASAQPPSLQAASATAPAKPAVLRPEGSASRGRHGPGAGLVAWAMMSSPVRAAASIMSCPVVAYRLASSGRTVSGRVMTRSACTASISA